MVNHPRRNRLAQYGGRIVTIDERRTVELRDEGQIHQYRRALAGVMERRILRGDASPMRDTGSPWEPVCRYEVAAMVAVRGRYHPILDPLGL